MPILKFISRIVLVVYDSAFLKHPMPILKFISRIVLVVYDSAFLKHRKPKSYFEFNGSLRWKIIEYSDGTIMGTLPLT